MGCPSLSRVQCPTGYSSGRLWESPWVTQAALDEGILGPLGKDRSSSVARPSCRVVNFKLTRIPPESDDPEKSTCTTSYYTPYAQAWPCKPEWLKPGETLLIVRCLPCLIIIDWTDFKQQEGFEDVSEVRNQTTVGPMSFRILQSVRWTPEHSPLYYKAVGSGCRLSQIRRIRIEGKITPCRPRLGIWRRRYKRQVKTGDKIKKVKVKSTKALRVRP